MAAIWDKKTLDYPTTVITIDHSRYNYKLLNWTIYDVDFYYNKLGNTQKVVSIPSKSEMEISWPDGQYEIRITSKAAKLDFFRQLKPGITPNQDDIDWGTWMNLGDRLVQLGSYVRFGGRLWRVIGENRIITDDLVGDSQFKAVYNPAYTSTPAYWLNRDFLTSLSTDQQFVIDTQWLVGVESDEASNKVTCKVGILTQSQYLRLYGVIFPLNGEGGSYWWLSTRQLSSSDTFYRVNARGEIYDGGGGSSATYPTRAIVRVLSTLGTEGSGTKEDPYRLTTNRKPVVVLSTQDNFTLTETNVLSITGSATDPDNGNVVTIKCKINNGTERNIGSGISDGNAPIAFSKNFTYRGGRLYYGSTDVSGLLAEGTTHTLSVWAVDDQGGQSVVVTRTFTVKYNKAPALTVNTFTPVQSGLIPPDTITLSGTASDPDGNTVTVKGKLNTGTEKTLLSGVSSGNWSFLFKVSELKTGANTITITATDQFGAATVKTFNVKNEVVEKPMKQGVARYRILPPLGSAKEILAWQKREKGDLVIDAEASFVDAGQPEQYVAMVKDSVDLNTEITEDQLYGMATAPKADVIFKQTLSRTNANSTQAATMLVGVFK